MKKMKMWSILLVIAGSILLVLYSYFIADTIETRIADAQMTKVDGRFMIATESRPLVNSGVSAFPAACRYLYEPSLG